MTNIFPFKTTQPINPVFGLFIVFTIRVSFKQVLEINTGLIFLEFSQLIIFLLFIMVIKFLLSQFDFCKVWNLMFPCVQK